MRKIKDLTSLDTDENLVRLATYLESLPADYEDFDMRDFLEANGLDALLQYVEQNGSVQSCGTAACAVGHGPAAHMFMNAEERKLMREDDPGLAWFAYSNRVFDAPESSPQFDWMFGGGWGNADNSVRGAAARIRYYLDHGAPDNFEHVSMYSYQNYVNDYQEYIKS